MLLTTLLHHLVTFLTLNNFFVEASTHDLVNLLVYPPYDPKEKGDLFPKSLQFKYERQTDNRAISKLECSPCTI